MTQTNAQSTSEQIISENDLIAQRHAKLKQIEDQAKETGMEQIIASMQDLVPHLIGSHIISDAGHWLQQERTSEVTTLILSFLNKVAAVGSQKLESDEQINFST